MTLHNNAILEEQKQLASEGYYKGKLDGIDGPLTRAARIAKFSSSTGLNWMPDARSVSHIQTLLPAVQKLAINFLRRLTTCAYDFKITSGTRTYAEQDALYAQGRTKPGKRVTAARGGYSNHNFGLAFDITLFNGPMPVYESPLYAKVAPIGKSLGLTWGGDWKSGDEPHYELRPYWARNLSETAMLTELRRRKEAGLDYLA